MEQIRQQSAHAKRLNSMFWAENTLLDLQKRKELETDKKQKIALLNM